MKYNFTPIITKILSILQKEGFVVERVRGDHIIINKIPSLRRPIVLVNVKKPSNIVRQNLIRACFEAGMKKELIDELNELLRY